MYGTAADLATIEASVAPLRNRRALTYNDLRDFESPIKEGKQAVAVTRLSCHRLRANEKQRLLKTGGFGVPGRAGEGSLDATEDDVSEHPAAP
jgi:hypothetical protein